MIAGARAPLRASPGLCDCGADHGHAVASAGRAKWATVGMVGSGGAWTAVTGPAVPRSFAISVAGLPKELPLDLGLSGAALRALRTLAGTLRIGRPLPPSVEFRYHQERQQHKEQRTLRMQRNSLITDAARIKPHFRAGRRAHRATADRTGPPRRCAILFRLGTSPNNPRLGRSVLRHVSPTRLGR